MSDDEGDDDGDYEPLGVGDEPLDDDGPGADAEADADAEDLEGDEAAAEAAGTDDEDEGDEGDEAEAEGLDDEPPEPAAQKARPERARVDPMLRASNKPRYVQVVAPEDRVTDNRLHKSEAALVIAMRAQQIAKHATVFTDGGPLHDPAELAFKELLDRRCPLVLRRLIGHSPAGEQVVEEWVVREMTLPPLTPPAALGRGREYAPAPKR
jgi:DNA-directed RNA polymerase subunit K/omega